MRPGTTGTADAVPYSPASFAALILILIDQRFALLEYACQEHTAGLTQADVSVQACWDADRLDLLRVGTRPRPDRLCTAAAREPDLLAWANSRASTREVPELIRDEWRLDFPGGLPRI